MDISVIIPVYNDSNGIETTLSSLVSQNISSDRYEVIVVDNGSTDETPSVISSYQQKWPETIQMHYETEIQGSYAARNTGLEQSKGNILAFIDADMSVKPTWLSSILRFFDERDCDYVGCNVEITIPKNEQSIWARYNKARGFPVEHYIKHHNFAPTCCMAVRQSVIEDVGQFDERLVSGGDSEFGKRVAKAGYTQCFASEITMIHPARTTPSELISKGVRLGRGRYQVRTYHPEVFGYDRLSISDFLPPHPIKYRRRISSERSVHLFVIYYVLESILKVAKLYGILSELSSKNRN